MDGREGKKIWGGRKKTAKECCLSGIASNDTRSSGKGPNFKTLTICICKQLLVPTQSSVDRYM